MDKLLLRAHNLREKIQLSNAHAEMLAISKANEVVGYWRLEDCIMYVTLEPCPMCAGAIVQSRIPTVIYGAKDPKGGCCGTIYNLLDESKFNHQCEVISGVLEEDVDNCCQIFFRELRQKKSSSVLTSKSQIDILNVYQSKLSFGTLIQ